MLLIVCFGFCGGGGGGGGGVIARPNYGWQAVGNQIFLAIDCIDTWAALKDCQAFVRPLDHTLFINLYKNSQNLAIFPLTWQQ